MGSSRAGESEGMATQPSVVRAVAGVALASVLIAAVVVVVAQTVATSSARVAASTSTDGFLTSGTVVIERADASASLLFDADDLYPGRIVEGCVVVDYAGSVPADIRLRGERVGGNGLDDFIELSLTALPGGECPGDEIGDSADDDADRRVFGGRLSELWTEHSTYATGIAVSADVNPGDRLALRAIAVVVDDNRAAGLTTDFVVTLEGRPR